MLFILLMICGGLVTIYPEIRSANEKAVLSDFDQFQANANRTLGQNALDRIPNYDGGILRFSDILKDADGELAPRTYGFSEFLGMMTTALSIIGLVMEVRTGNQKKTELGSN